jgi:hypothetical protein
MLNLVFNKPINHDFKTIFLTKSHLIVVFNDDSTKMNKLYKMKLFREYMIQTIIESLQINAPIRNNFLSYPTSTNWLVKVVIGTYMYILLYAKWSGKDYVASPFIWTRKQLYFFSIFFIFLFYFDFFLILLFYILSFLNYSLLFIWFFQTNVSIFDWCLIFTSVYSLSYH